MITDRMYEVLKYLERAGEPLTKKETPYEYEDLSELERLGYVYTSSKAVPVNGCNDSSPHTAYKINKRGAAAIRSYERVELRESDNRRIAKRTLALTVVSVIIAAVSLLVAIASLILSIVPV